MPNIAIIGCGAAGVASFSAIVDDLCAKNFTNVTIDVFNRNDDFGAGLAYSTEIEKHRLNMRADTMSIDPNNPHDFVAWMHENGYAEEYPARKIFGDYLKTRLSEKIAQAEAAGITCHFYPNTVVDIEETRTKVGITLAGEDEPRFYDRSLLCIGNYANTSYKKLQDNACYVEDVWNKKAFTIADKNASVLILGTGLTAIDSYIALRDKGHLGAISMVSRHGLLPKVRPPASEPYTLEILTEEHIDAKIAAKNRLLTLEEMITLFREEFRTAGIATDIFKPSEQLVTQSIFETLQQDKDNATDYSKAFSVLKAIDDKASYLWNVMQEDARKQFDKHYKTLWYAYDYPMPSVTADYLLEEMKAGKLNILRGINDIDYHQETEKFEPQLSPHVRQLDNPSENMQFDYVVNGIGIGVDVENIQDPLLQNGIEKGLFTPHQFGGIKIKPEDGRIITQRGVSDRIQLIGSLTRGNLFYVNSLEQVVKASNAAAKACTQSLEEKSFRGQKNPGCAEIRKY